MVKFKTTIRRFNEQGEKTGWTYINIPAAVAQKLKPGNKRSFRVKGKLDDYSIKGIAIMPMGGGDFIMAMNADIRKGTGKRHGAELQVQLEVDNSPILPPPELIECLKDEPKALEYYNTLTPGHRNYFTKWIETAKTEPTKTKRIALVVEAMFRQCDFGQMLRDLKAKKDKLMGY